MISRNNDFKELILGLVRLGTGKGDLKNDTKVETLILEKWERLKDLARKQGLLAVVLDGIDRLTSSGIVVDIPKTMRLEWIGEVLQGYECRYELYKRAIAEMARFYNSNGFKMMVLKGYACSLDWPNPGHRPTGDIDIWLFGRQMEADALLQNVNECSEVAKSIKHHSRNHNIKIDMSHHHHTIFYWRDFMVENHYDFVNVHAHKSSREMEKVFKELGQDDSIFVDVYGERVYLPSPNLHSLFLIRHMVAHFVGSEITLRQVLDWAFFAEKHTKEIDWKWLENQLENFHMKEFYNCINAICVCDLGFDMKIFSDIQFEPSLKERILDDIISPEFKGDEPRNFFARIIFKYRRWQANTWKQELCYPESKWDTFWSGVWNHMLKPGSI